MTDLRNFCCSYCGSSYLRQVTNLTLVSGDVSRAHSCQECGALNLINEVALHYETVNAQAEFHEVEFGWADLKTEDIQREIKEIESLAEYLSNKMAELKDNECILDIGCGKGTLVHAFRSIGMCAFGVDGSQKLVELGNKAAFYEDGPVLYHADVKSALEEIKKTGEFKGYRVKNVVAWHVLEHIVDAKRVVSSVADILPEEGVLCVQLPGISPANLISSHFFLSNKKNISKLGDGLGINCVGQHADIDNMYFTGFYRKGVAETQGGQDNGIYYDGLEEAICLLKEHVDWIGGELRARDGRIEGLIADVDRGEYLRLELMAALGGGELKVKSKSEQLYGCNKKDNELSAQLAEFVGKARENESQLRVYQAEVDALQTEIKRLSDIIAECEGMGPKQHFLVFLRKLLEGLRIK